VLLESKDYLTFADNPIRESNNPRVVEKSFWPVVADLKLAL